MSKIYFVIFPLLFILIACRGYDIDPFGGKKAKWHTDLSGDLIIPHRDLTAKFGIMRNGNYATIFLPYGDYRGCSYDVRTNNSVFVDNIKNFKGDNWNKFICIKKSCDIIMPIYVVEGPSRFTCLLGYVRTNVAQRSVPASCGNLGCVTQYGWIKKQCLC